MTDAATLTPLETLRGRLSGCEIAVLADLRSQTCLLSSSILPVGQERFDGLCQEARHILGHDAPFPETLAVRLSFASQKVFFRLGVETNEAICLVFAPSASLAGVDALCLSFLQEQLKESTDAG